ncbi:MAG: hypothetical protein ABIH85_01595 [Candidatus Omnitrophota bacterium]|nr:hypothetical protein [Candidatus Omnitrophota bacterium]
MKKLLRSLIFTFYISSLFNTTISFSEEVPKNETTSHEEEAPEIKKEEIVSRLKNIFDYNPEILATFPEVKSITNAEGITSYSYNGADIDSVDRETLFSLMQRVNSQVSWKNFQRTQRQLRTLKQMDNFNRTQRMLRNQTQSAPKLPKIPKTYTPPKIPKTYKPAKRY